LTQAALDAHIARIAIVAARQASIPADVIVCLLSLGAVRDRVLARGDLVTLSEIGDLIIHLRALSSTLAAEVNAAVADAERVLTSVRAGSPGGPQLDRWNADWWDAALRFLLGTRFPE
jgi:hypothetical protein